MNFHLILVKIRYAFFSPILWVKLLFNKIQFPFAGCFAEGPITVVTKRNSSISLGKGCRFICTSASNLIGINHRCILSTHEESAQIIIGQNCGFSGTTIGSFKSITIGNNVRCGANTVITDSDWHLDDPRSGLPNAVLIGNNVWLGYGTIVLKGVSIGENTVIGAGSVVTRDIPANVVAAGNPCKVIKQLKIE